MIPAASEPLRHCAFYWSLGVGGEPVPGGMLMTGCRKTYRTFDTEFEARGFAGAHGGEYRLLPMPATAQEVRSPPQKTMRGNDIRDLQRSQRTMVIPDHDDEQGNYPFDGDNDWTDPWQT